MFYLLCTEAVIETDHQVAGLWPCNPYWKITQSSLNWIIIQSILITIHDIIGWASWLSLVVKNLPANAVYKRDVGFIPGSGRCPGEGMAIHSSILAWRILWTKEFGRLQSIRLQNQIWLKQLSSHRCNIIIFAILYLKRWYNNVITTGNHRKQYLFINISSLTFRCFLLFSQSYFRHKVVTLQ